jgi:hypothetical protein
VSSANGCGKTKKQIWREYIRERYGSAPDGIDQSTNDIVVNGSQQLERELLPKEALTERENEMNETLDLHPFCEGDVADTAQQSVEPEYTIDLSKVLLSDRFRCRERENEETIEEYAERNVERILNIRSRLYGFGGTAINTFWLQDSIVLKPPIEQDSTKSE